LIALVALVSTGAGCADHEAPDGPNVLLITIDTLRADRTGPYRSDADATPNMSRLAREGTLFEAAISPMQMTRPSHDSLFTSLYPRNHGVVNNKIALGERFRSVAHEYRDAGYATAAFTAVTLLAPGSGVERGFDHFEPPTRSRTRPAHEVVRSAIRWLEMREKDRPFFVWVHLFDPHTPYSPPPAFAPKANDAHARALPEASIEGLIAVAAEHEGNLPRGAVERAMELYQGDIEFADHWLGRLLGALDARGLTSETAVVLTADHGECFENGIYFEHSDCLYEGAARIPLIFRFPGRVEAGVRRNDVVEILDVAPTLLSLSNLPVPEAFLGRDLFDPGTQARDVAFLQHPLYSNTGARNRSLRRLERVMGRETKPVLVSEEMLGIRTREWKYLMHGDHEELYDLDADPTEARNVAQSHPEVAGRLRAQLEAWSAAHPQYAAQVELINDEMRATLEALGYVH
jgi:arylsulfatase A-like enzyme